MMKSLVLALVCSFACSFAPLSKASTVSSAVPSFLTYLNNGVVLVYFLKTTRSGTVPVCSPDMPGIYFRLAINATTPGGKVQLAGLLAAYTTREAVFARGSGDCSVQSDTETLQDFNTAR